MAEEKKERVFRSKEERKAEIEKKIKFHEDCIKKLKADLKKIDEPRKGGGRAKGVKRIMAESKLSDEETAKALGFASVDEMKAKLLEAAAKKDN